MSLSIRDTITPDLRRKAAQIADKRPILEAMGLQLVSLTKRAFSNADLRAKPWPARKKPAPHNLLRKSGAMWQSIRISNLSNSSVTVASDRVYAARQQFGGGGIPSRPFFPWASPESQMTPTAQEKIRKVALAKIASILGA